MSEEIECVVWCPHCGIDKYEVRRIPTGANGVYEHKAYRGDPLKEPPKICECGTVLERRTVAMAEVVPAPRTSAKALPKRSQRKHKHV